MNVRSITIVKLYGYFDKKVTFNKDINLLVGINGSGKTSVLNLLAWVLTPSIPHLCVTEFERIELEFEFEGEEYTSIVTQDTKTLYYTVENRTNEKNYNPLKVVLRVPPKQLINNEEHRHRALHHYVNLNPDLSEAETWHFLTTLLPKPVTIGLDRTKFEGVQPLSSYVSPYDIENLMIPVEVASQTGENSPLKNVKEVANNAYSIYRNKVEELNESLHNSLFMSAFDEITSSSIDELETIERISQAQIDSLHDRVTQFILENESADRGKLAKARMGKERFLRQQESVKKVNNYFKHLKSIMRVAQKSSESKPTLLYLANVSQFKKIKTLIAEFEKFDQKSRDYYSEIKLYLDTVNEFFKDSSKRLSFNRSLTKLVYHVLDKDGKPISRNRDIVNLSSGEKQILILFTYLKFNEKRRTLFIIDEPELSLHPKWQEEFLNAVSTLMVKNTQLILATHSPTIVGSNKQYCQVLLPYN